MIIPKYVWIFLIKVWCQLLELILLWNALFYVSMFLYTLSLYNKTKRSVIDFHEAHVFIFKRIFLFIKCAKFFSCDPAKKIYYIKYGKNSSRLFVFIVYLSCWNLWSKKTKIRLKLWLYFSLPLLA